MKAIVTTTINPPTEAILRYAEIAEKNDYYLIIVGDKKTPHEEYKKLAKDNLSVIYLHPDKQEKEYPKLSEMIGWNCIQRRNFGFLEAQKRKVELIATVDDDNIPYEDWGSFIMVNTKNIIDLYQPDVPVFDPLSVTEHSFLWHRGFPIDLVNMRSSKYVGQHPREILIQADLWDGDPDIDAMARMIYHPIVKFGEINPFAGTCISPFNSQNTFISGKVLKYYFLYPGIGRMDDIWASYNVQKQFPDSVVYSRASVYQQRNVHDLSTDLENEMYGIKHTMDFLLNKDVLPERAKKAYAEYQKYFH
jgi:hypothetical protein